MSSELAVEPAAVRQTYQQTDFPIAVDHQEHLFVAELTLLELRISQQCCLMMLAASLKMDL